MKRLNIFSHVDVETMVSNMELKAMKSEILSDFETKKELGAKYTVLIWSDSNDYGTTGVSNAGETFTVKMLGQKPKPIETPIDIELVNPTGVIYGDYRNQLSVTADDIILL